MKNILVKKLLLLTFAILTVITYGCLSGETKIYDYKSKVALGKNRLVHLSISEPKGWLLGADESRHVLAEFPFTGEPTPIDVDYVVFHQPTTKSNIFVSYKPILGRSYFKGNPQEVTDLFEDAIMHMFKERKQMGIIKDFRMVELGTKMLGDIRFYTFRYKITPNMSEERMVYIFLNIPDDLKSLYMFCFSTKASTAIEENQPFRDFIAMTSGFKPYWLNSYDEILYRNYAKSWIFREYSHHMKAELSKAIVDDSIEELKESVSLMPDAWEPHFLLAKEYGEKYFLGYKVVYLSVPGGTPQEVMETSYSALPVDANAAIREYKYLIDLNPNFNLASKWILIRFQLESASKPNLEDVYRGIAKSYACIGKYDEAIFYLEEGIKKIPSEKYLENDLTGMCETRAIKNVEKGNFDLALQDYIKLLSKAQDAFLVIAYREEIAEIYIKKGMRNEALEEYLKALEIAKKEKWSSSIDKIENKIKVLQN